MATTITTGGRRRSPLSISSRLKYKMATHISDPRLTAKRRELF